MARRDVRADHARRDQFGQQAGPFLTEQVRAGQASVTADHHEGVDAPLQQVPGRTQPPVTGAELLGPCGAEDRATLSQDPLA
jgi:hypothetical protein